MDWCEKHGVHYIFGLSTNAVLAAQIFAKTDEVCVRRAIANLDVVRDYTETLCGANPGRIRAASWRGSRRPSRVSIRPLCRHQHHLRCAEWLYDSLYCARGQAENLIKRHKSQLASDRTSCRSPLANQMRLILHTAAYWLMLTVRDAIPRPQALANGEFSTLRLRLLKIAVRIKETASRIKLAFAANCPDAALFRGLLGALIPRPT